MTTTAPVQDDDSLSGENVVDLRRGMTVETQPAVKLQISDPGAEVTRLGDSVPITARDEISPRRSDHTSSCTSAT